MISRGDLVKMRLSVNGDSGDGVLKEIFILGRVLNYCEEEETYILDPKVISVPKEQVAAIDRLPEDFDFSDVSFEISMTQEERTREKPPEISDIRFTR